MGIEIPFRGERERERSADAKLELTSATVHPAQQGVLRGLDTIGKLNAVVRGRFDKNPNRLHLIYVQRPDASIFTVSGMGRMRPAEEGSQQAPPSHLRTFGVSRLFHTVSLATASRILNCSQVHWPNTQVSWLLCFSILKNFIRGNTKSPPFKLDGVVEGY